MKTSTLGTKVAGTRVKPDKIGRMRLNEVTELRLLSEIRVACRTGESKALRIRAGIRQGELAKTIDVAQSVLSRWENAKRVPTGSAAIRFALLLPEVATPCSPRGRVVRFLTVKECAEMTSTTERWWRRAIFEKRLPVVKLGGRTVRIAEQDLMAFIEACKEGGDA